MAASAALGATVIRGSAAVVAVVTHSPKLLRVMPGLGWWFASQLVIPPQYQHQEVLPSQYPAVQLVGVSGALGAIVMTGSGAGAAAAKPAEPAAISTMDLKSMLLIFGEAPNVKDEICLNFSKLALKQRGSEIVFWNTKVCKRCCPAESDIERRRL